MLKGDILEIENKKMYDLVSQKDQIYEDGLKTIALMEAEDKIIKSFEEQEKRITGKVKPDEKLKEEGDALAVIFNDTLKKLDEIGNKIEAEKMKAIPQEIIDNHKLALKRREELERVHNKEMLKIQKIKDRLIPLIKTSVKPFLQEYDDVETAIIKGNKVTFRVYNHIEDYKRKFKKY